MEHDTAVNGGRATIGLRGRTFGLPRQIFLTDRAPKTKIVAIVIIFLRYSSYNSIATIRQCFELPVGLPYWLLLNISFLDEV